MKTITILEHADHPGSTKFQFLSPIGMNNIVGYSLDDGFFTIPFGALISITDQGDDTLEGKWENEDGGDIIIYDNGQGIQEIIATEWYPVGDLTQWCIDNKFTLIKNFSNGN